MSKKGTKALASATLMSLVLTTALSAGPVKAAAGQAERIGAADRYATAAQVATKNWTTSDNVVLVSGEGYADAVSASALAKKLNAPILLTTAKTLSTDTASALSKLGAKNVYVVGGEASVSTAVRTELKKTYSLVELGGANRYETNVAVAQKLVDLGVDPSSVIMVGGEGFSDALSVAPVAAAKGQILLLGMNNADYMKPVLDFVAKNKSKVTVVGTKNVISEDILKTVGGTRVDGGKDRWDTNQKVLANFKDTVKKDKLYVASAAYNAKDDGYADALVASALAGKYAAPLVLVDKDGNEGTVNALSYIKNNANKSTDLQVVGGTGVVSDSLLGKITEAVSGSTTPIGDATVSSITANGLSQIKVVFNTDVDSDSAETVSNYKVDGVQLSANKAAASLQDDNRTLIINLSDVKQQNKSYDVEVKDGVLSADKTRTIAKYNTSVSFSDTTAPTVSSVSVRGNSKLTVKFSEPILLTTDGSGYANGTFTGKFKINGQNISGFGLSKAVPKDVVAKNGDGVTTSSTIWADGVDLYFSSKLPSGSNTLKISEGDANGALSDAAGFVVAETTQNFTVDAVTTAPVIKEVKADADGTLRVRFDRPMDEATATVGTNYGLNGDNASLKDGKLKENDCTVKFTGTDLKTGANTIYIKNSVKDAYGNKVADDTRVPFTNAKDETKPTVTNVSMIDSSTIRMTFSKDVNADYAKQISNYTLKDSTGADVKSNIDVIRPSISTATTASSISAPNDNDNVWDIKMNSAHKLTGSKYTLTIKNLIDTTSNQNVMDEYTTTLTGNDDVAPKLEGAYTKADSDKKYHKVVLFFSEEMDTATLGDLGNYKFQNGNGDTNKVPSGTSITIGSDNKSVTLELPSNYYPMYTGANDKGVLFDNIDKDNQVKNVLVSGLKDVAGNVIDSFANSFAVKPASGQSNVKYKADTYRILHDGDDLLAKFQFDGSIDTDSLQRTDFTVGGETPDSVYVDGSDVVLRFSKDVIGATTTSAAASYSGYSINPEYTATNLTKIDNIKAQGSNAALVVNAGQVLDAADAPIAVQNVAKVYDYLAAPKTSSDYWYATANNNNSATVVITFDNQIDTHSGVKTDDYTFVINGAEVKANSVDIVKNTLVFTFTTDSARFTTGAKVNVALKNKSINVEALKDDDGNYAKYVPSADDTTKTIKVNIH